MIVLRLKSVEEMYLSPLGLEPMSVAPMAQYLNAPQRKLGTIRFRLSISYSMIVRTQAHCQ
jgi:hypothetical protein